MTNCADKLSTNEEFFLSNHAIERMNLRHITYDDVENVISYGRMVHTKGAVVYVVGAKEARLCRSFGTNLDRCDGIHVVCSNDNMIITVYKNNDLRGLKPRRRATWGSKGSIDCRHQYLEAA